ncbi:hypothetical protein [Gemmatimonas aurantiaca]|uniref:hypothetical protein n=1 Tax=Gemmatimonas aurantiaca TaxID=173480 RepID=UPI00301D609B
MALCMMPASGRAQSSGTKPDSSATKAGSTKGGSAKATGTKTTGTSTAKPTTTKASTKGASTTKPTTTKPSTGTTSTPAKTTAPAKPAGTTQGASQGSTGAAPSSGGASASGTSRSRNATGRPVPFTDGGLRLYGGAASASLGFGTGLTAGLAWRLLSVRDGLSLRADIAGSRFSQTPLALGSGAALTQATLTHVGGSLSAELALRRTPGIQPYIGAGVGVYRFQADGPAGQQGVGANDIFASTTDVAGIATVGLRLTSRIFIEARYITVGDFQSIPFTAGVRF